MNACLLLHFLLFLFAVKLMKQLLYFWPVPQPFRQSSLLQRMQHRVCVTHNSCLLKKVIDLRVASMLKKTLRNLLPVMKSVSSPLLVLYNFVERVEPEVQLRHVDVAVEVDPSALVALDLHAWILDANDFSVVEAVTHRYLSDSCCRFQPNIECL